MLMPTALWAQGIAGDSTAVAAPTFRFVGDLLYIETETEGASIFYRMEELPNMDEATIDKISSDMTVTADGQQSIYYHEPIEITKSVIIKAIAASATVSEVSTLVYDYYSWIDLLKAVEYGTDVYNRAQNNEKVDSISLSELAWMLDEAKMIYGDRAAMDSYEAQHFSSHIMEIAHQIEEMMGSDVPVVNYSFGDNGVLWVDSDVTMAQVMEEASQKHNVAEHITAIVWHSSQPLTNSDLQVFDNPNMLIFVESESLAPQNRNNVVVGDFAKNIVLADAKEGNNNFYCPQAFTAEEVTYTRNFQQHTQVGVSQGWESIALPFNVQTITHEKQGVIAPFGNTASEKHFWLRRLGDSGLIQATKIEANVPYIISMPNNNEVYNADYNLSGKVMFTAQDVVVPVTAPVTLAMADNSVLMVPAFQSVGRSSDVWALNVGEVRGQYLEGSAFERDYREIRPFEAYTVHRSNTPAPRFVPIKDMTNGDVTGIEDVRGMMSDGRGEGAWYDLNGRKIVNGKSVNGKLPRGVYIQNGKKVVIK